MDTPFKGANKWFVDDSKSNRSRQPGTSRTQGEDTNILLGIATPLPPRATVVKDWGDRDPPPHKSDPKETNIASSVRSNSSRNSARRTQEYRGRSGGDPPEGDDGDDSRTASSRSRRSNRSGHRPRRSTTLRPRRRSSSTPRPHRQRPAPDDDDDGSDSSGFSSDSSSWDTEYTSRSRRRRRSSRRDNVHQ